MDSGFHAKWPIMFDFLEFVGTGESRCISLNMYIYIYTIMSNQREVSSEIFEACPGLGTSGGVHAFHRRD